MWHYISREDYEQYIKPMPNSKLKMQLLSQYKARIPMLKESHFKLLKKYSK